MNEVPHPNKVHYMYLRNRDGHPVALCAYHAVGTSSIRYVLAVCMPKHKKTTQLEPGLYRVKIVGDEFDKKKARFLTNMRVYSSNYPGVVLVEVPAPVLEQARTQSLVVLGHIEATHPREHVRAAASATWQRLSSRANTRRRNEEAPHD